MKKQKTVLLALSGGVDSAVAALILKKQGFKIICAFMKNFSETKDKITGECNWIEDKKMAQKIAAHLNLPFIVLDFEKEYRKQVIEPMFRDYRKGLTPNPDILCNTIIKFPLLWIQAKKFKADYVATGHYARIKKTKKGFELLQAKDKTKDQSYFLCELNQHDLEHTLFPIGNYNKFQVRQIAKQNHLPNYNRPSTKGVCFIGNIPMKQFLEKKIKPKPGNVLNDKNQIIGRHKGAFYYTIGERARHSIGINIEKGELSQERFFIAKKNMKNNTLTIVPKNHSLLKSTIFELKNLKWVNERDKKSKISAQVRVRHLGTLMPSTLMIKNGKSILNLKNPEQGIAPGQSAVFYIKDQVICSGEIQSR